MVDLHRANVFLAAGLPSGPRAAEVAPFDPLAITDAVAALTRAVFVAGGRLVSGGHPTITPLILLIASEFGHRNVVDVYQSQWFRDSIPPETHRLVDSGVGQIVWTQQRRTFDESLTELRVRMFTESQPIGGVFIGGMSGLFEEYELFLRHLPDRLCVPLAGPGGAARLIASDPRNYPANLAREVDSLAYPAACRAILEAMAQRAL